ncbi:hypothetical protein [Deinococcus peraridilitoris]|nr:hypothetical protein [Deinococcus peraridilitoris]
MKHWILLGRTDVPGSVEELRLMQRGEEFSIVLAQGGELMNSRVHASEDALAHLACALIAERAQPRVLIGGLGMGFTLAAALRTLPDTAEVTVAELVSGLVEWNRGPLGACAGHPLLDHRVRLHVGDVGQLLRAQTSAFDAIVLDVDNGPEGLTRPGNDQLYSAAGLRAAAQALRTGGVLAVWSAHRSEVFTRRLRQEGFHVEEHTVRARPGAKGARHTIWLAERRFGAPSRSSTRG